MLFDRSSRVALTLCSVGQWMKQIVSSCLRTITALSTIVLFISVPLAAVNPSKEGPSLEETLKYINERLYSSQNYADRKCSDTIQLSLSESHEELVVKYLIIDRHDKIIENTPSEYIYYVPIGAVRSVYTWGPWTTHDRIVVKTSGDMVRKYGPVWDCGHSKLNEEPKVRLLGSVDLKIQDPDDDHLSGVTKAVKHLVRLLQAELNAKSASEQNNTNGPGKQDTPPDHN